MAKPRNMSEAIKMNAIYQRAQEEWREGHLVHAFRLFLAAAKAGSDPACSTVGCFYQQGIGVKADEDAALGWYRRAYRRGSMLAANNIGIIWRGRGKPDRALLWLRRAVRLGDGDANLEIAKIYLNAKPNVRRAVYYLNKARKAKFITEGSKEDAKGLLKDIHKKLPARGRAGKRVAPRGGERNRQWHEHLPMGR